MLKLPRYLNSANLRSTANKNKPLLKLQGAIPLRKPKLEPVHLPKPVCDVRISTKAQSPSLLVLNEDSNQSSVVENVEACTFVSLPLSTYTSPTLKQYQRKGRKHTRPLLENTTWTSTVPGWPKFGNEFVALCRLSKFLLTASKSQFPKAYADELVRWLSKLYDMYPTSLKHLTVKAWDFLFSLESDRIQLPSFRAKVIGDAAVAAGVELTEAQEIIYIGGLFWNGAKGQAFNRFSKRWAKEPTETIAALGVKMYCIENKPNRALSAIDAMKKLMGPISARLYIPIILIYNHLYKGGKAWSIFETMLETASSNNEKIKASQFEDIAVSFLEAERPEKAINVFMVMVRHGYMAPKYMLDIAIAVQDLIRTPKLLSKFSSNLIHHFKYQVETKKFYGNWMKNLGNMHQPWLALRCLERMQKRGIMPDDHNINGAIRAFLMAGLPEQAEKIAAKLIAKRLSNNEIREKKRQQDHVKREIICKEQERTKAKNKRLGLQKRLLRNRQRVEVSINVSLLQLIELDAEFRNILAQAKSKDKESSKDDYFQFSDQQENQQKDELLGHFSQEQKQDTAEAAMPTSCDNSHDPASVLAEQDKYSPILPQRMQYRLQLGHLSVVTSNSVFQEAPIPMLLLHQPKPLLQLPPAEGQMPLNKRWDEAPEANSVTFSMVLGYFARRRDAEKVFHYFSLMKTCKLSITAFPMNHLLWAILRQRDFTKLAKTFKTMTQKSGVAPDMITWKIMWQAMWKQTFHRRLSRLEFYMPRELFAEMAWWLSRYNEWGRRDHAIKVWEVVIRTLLVSRDCEAVIVALNAGYRLWGLRLNKRILEEIFRALVYKEARMRKMGAKLETGNRTKVLTKGMAESQIEELFNRIRQIQNRQIVTKKSPALIAAIQKEHAAYARQTIQEGVKLRQISTELQQAIASVIEDAQKKVPKEMDEAMLDAVMRALIQLADNSDSMIFIERLKDAREQMGVSMVGIKRLLEAGWR